MRVPPLNWFRRAKSAPISELSKMAGLMVAEPRLSMPQSPAVPVAPSSPPTVPEMWSQAHAALLDDLFGDGYVTPGGEEEILKLARPIGLSEGMTLLLVGGGTGGPVLSLAAEFGVWVSGYEAVPAFAKVAERRIQRARLGPRASLEPWFPSAPEFRPRFFHHAMALLPLDGENPEKMLAAIVKSLKPGGHLVMLEIVADPPIKAEEKTMKTWLTLDGRLATMPSETTVTRAMTKLGFEVHVAEDVTDQHLLAITADWQRLMRKLDGRPDPSVAALMALEAERWTLRSELMRVRRVFLVRWHAVLKAP